MASNGADPSSASTSLRALVTRLEAADIASADEAALHRITGDCARVQSWLALTEAAVANRAQTLHEAGRSGPPETVLGAGGARSGRNAKAATRRAQTVNSSPAMAQALADGGCSADHADALGNAKSKLDDSARTRFEQNEAELIQHARSMSADAFARRARRAADLASGDEGVGEFEKARRQSTGSVWRDPETNMTRVSAALDPERGAILAAALRQEVNRLWRLEHGDLIAPSGVAKNSQLCAQALYNLVTGAPGSATSSDGSDRAGRGAEVMVLIDYDTLVGQLRTDSVCEASDGTVLPPETVRRMACNAGNIPAVLGGDGVSLDLGRSARVASHHQRLALRAMYSGCADASCDAPFEHCQIHHLEPWHPGPGAAAGTAGGPTDLANLVPVCNKLHHLLHEGGWTAELDTDRTLRLYKPDGTLHSVNPLETPGADAAIEPRSTSSGRRSTVEPRGPTMRYSDRTRTTSHPKHRPGARAWRDGSKPSLLFDTGA